MTDRRKHMSDPSIPALSAGALRALLDPKGVVIDPSRYGDRDEGKAAGVIAVTWAGGLRPDYVSVTHKGLAALAEIQALAEGLTSLHRDVLLRHERVRWGSAATDDALDDLYSDHLVDHEGNITPLGTAALTLRERAR